VVVDYYKKDFRDPEHVRLEKPDVIKESSPTASA
jgi:hypothetical protein